MFVKWTTTDEQRLRNFEIQKSSDGNSFSTIGSVQPSGNLQTQNTYEFSDKASGSGTSYSRLKITDLDGTVRFSKVVVIKTSAVTVRSIDPNPFKGQLNAVFELNSNMPVTIKLLTTAGREVLIQNLSGEKGTNLIVIPIRATLMNGLYILSIRANNETS